MLIEDVLIVINPNTPNTPIIPTIPIIPNNPIIPIIPNIPIIPIILAYRVIAISSDHFRTKHSVHVMCNLMRSEAAYCLVAIIRSEIFIRLLRGYENNGGQPTGNCPPSIWKISVITDSEV